MKITILFLGKSGGACIYTYEMLRSLLAVGCTIQAVLCDYIENKPDFIRLENYKNYTQIFIPTYRNRKEFLSKSLNVIKFIKLAYTINKFNSDWVYIPMISLWCRFVLPFLNRKIKIVTTIHDVAMHLGEKNLLIDCFNSYIIKKSDKIITLSESFIDKISNKYEIAKENICWIRHANYNYYRPAFFKNAISLTNKILFFGRIHEYKGVSILLDAMEVIKNTNKDITLRIAGRGQISSDNMAKIKKLGSSVELINKWIPNNEIFKYFENIDFVVVPYIEASQSGVIMLAYTFGKPVIVTDVGGLPEQVFDDTGIVISSGEYKALAAAILKMYAEPEKIINMGNSAYEKNNTVFSWAESVQRLLLFLSGSAE